MDNKIIKLEIIISKAYMKTVIDFLNERDVNGYTILEISGGKGIFFGEHTADGISNDTLWVLVFIVISYNEYGTFKHPLELLLKIIHGSCFVTEVKETINIDL